MMGEWMASQIKANERMKDHVVKLDRQIMQGLRNHQAMIEDLERKFNIFIRRSSIPNPILVPQVPNRDMSLSTNHPLLIEEDEIEPILAMTNPSPTMYNSPTVSPFAKDCTVHIPYTQKKVMVKRMLGCRNRLISQAYASICVACIIWSSIAISCARIPDFSLTLISLFYIL
nr:hypothetical protein [Tanacetum cinerariifolium]